MRYSRNSSARRSPTDPTAPAPARGQVALGRSRDQDRRRDPLAVAGRRPDRRRARRPGPEPARPAGHQAAAAQAPEEAGPGASGDDHGQAGELCRGEEGGDARGRAPPAQGAEQSSREFASANPAARTPDEAVQVGRPGAALSLCSRADQQPLPPSPRSPHCRRVVTSARSSRQRIRHQYHCWKRAESWPGRASPRPAARVPDARGSCCRSRGRRRQ